MRYPRHHKVFRGQLDVAPFAAVFFLLVIFLTFHSGLVLTPGISINLPAVSGLAGLTNRSVVVAVTENGACFYDNQITTERELATRFRALAGIAGPLTLVLQADGGVRNSNLVAILMVAREAGIRDTLIAVRPDLRMPIRPSPTGLPLLP